MAKPLSIRAYNTIIYAILLYSNTINKFYIKIHVFNV